MLPLRREKSWDFDETLKSGNTVSVKHRKDRRQNHKWITQFIPKSVRSKYPQPNESSEKIVYCINQYVCRIPIIITDEYTGEKKEIKMRTPMFEIALSGYRKVWSFKKSSKGNSYFDSRDEKRKSPEFIRNELIRYLGIEETKLISAEYSKWQQSCCA